jgi:hypothetical protein
MDQPALLSDDSQDTSSALAVSSLSHMSTLYPQDPPAPRSSLDSPCLYGKKRKKKQNNRVSFAVDSDDNIAEQYFIVDEQQQDRLSLTREDIAATWLSPMELLQIHRDAIRTAAGYRAKHASDSSQDIDQLFNVSQESSLIKSDSSQHLKLHDIPDQCRQACRGLERQVYTSIRNHIRRHTKTILKVQFKIPADVNSEMKARLLRARSLQLSKPSRILAKFLAHGDVLEVRGDFVPQ